MSFISDFISGFKEYVTQTWKNRPSTETPMSAERLNHIEAGIKSISDAIKNMASAIMKDMADLTIGASDWNAAEGEPGHVQNRTHWVEFVSKEEVILEETSVSFKNEMSSLYGLGSDKVIAGKPYIVHWNGTAYECTAFVFGQSTFLGNGSLSSVGTDTGEPFCMEMLTATSAFVMKADSNAESILVKVVTPEVMDYHKLDPKFLPEGVGGSADWAINSEFANGYVKNRTHWREVITEAETLFDQTIAFVSDMQYINIGSDKIKDGKTYVVLFKEKEYRCMAIERDGSIFLGNEALVSGLENTGEPFCFEVINANYSHITKNTADTESVVVNVKTEEIVEYHTLDPRYIKDMYYTEGGGSGELEEIFPEVTAVPLLDATGTEPLIYSVEEGSFISPTEISITPDSTYVVKLNGVEYECVALDATELFGSPSCMLGNIYGFTGGDLGTESNEPFVITVLSEPQDGMYMIGLMLEEVDSVTLGIYGGVSETIHKIDNKYLDLAWLPVKKKVPTVLFDETVHIGNNDRYTSLDGNLFKLTPGETYSITIDETSYESVCKKNIQTSDSTSAEYIYVGNLYLANETGDDTGEPFCFLEINLNGGFFGFTIVIDGYKGLDACILVTGPEIQPNKMPFEFLPDEVGKTIDISDTSASSASIAMKAKAKNQRVTFNENSEVLFAENLDAYGNNMAFVNRYGVFFSRGSYGYAITPIIQMTNVTFGRYVVLGSIGGTAFGDTPNFTTTDELRVKSPSGKWFRLVVDDNGNLTTEAV